MSGDRNIIHRKKIIKQRKNNHNYLHNLKAIKKRIKSKRGHQNRSNTVSPR